MDEEEEELENTLIGQQEKAPSVNTEDALIGAGQVDLTGQVNFQDDDVPESPRTADLSVFTPGGDLKPGIDVNAMTPAPTTLADPSTVNTALNQEVPIGPAPEKPGFFEPGGFGYEYLGPRLGDTMGNFFGEQLYGTGITADGQRTGFPVDRPSLAGDLLTLPGNLIRAVDFVAGPPVDLAVDKVPDVVDYVTGASGVQAQQDAKAARAAEAAQSAQAVEPTQGVTSPIETPSGDEQVTEVTQAQAPAIPEGAPGSPQANFAERMATGEPLTPQEIQDAQAFAASMGTTFDPATGYSRKAFEDAQAGAPRSDLFPNDPGVQRTRDELMRRFGAPTIREIQEQDAIRRFGGGATPAPATVNNFAPQAPSGQAGPAKVPDEIMSQVVRPGVQTMEFRDSNGDGIEDRAQGIFRPGELLGYDAQGNEVRSPGTQQPVNRGVVRDMLFRGPSQAVPLNTGPGGPPAAFSTGPSTGPRNVRDMLYREPVPNLSNFERESIARQIRSGGTGSFEGDSAAREARLAARPDFNEVRRDSDRRGGLSQADARDLAQGMAKDATEGERMRALQIQSRLGLGEFEPEKELTELEKREIESRISAREEDIAASKRKGGFMPRVINIGDQRAMELAPGYFQRIAKDTPQKSGLQKTLEFLQSDLDSGRLTQEQYDIAVRNAKNIYIGNKAPKQNEIDVQKRIDEIREEQMGATPVEGTDASDTRSFDTEAEAKASGVKGEVLIGGRRAVIE